MKYTEKVQGFLEKLYPHLNTALWIYFGIYCLHVIFSSGVSFLFSIFVEDSSRFHPDFFLYTTTISNQCIHFMQIFRYVFYGLFFVLFVLTDKIPTILIKLMKIHAFFVLQGTVFHYLTLTYPTVIPHLPGADQSFIHAVALMWILQIFLVLKVFELTINWIKKRKV